MDQESRRRIEQLLDESASQFPFPQTPDLTADRSGAKAGLRSGMRLRRPAWVLVALLVLLTVFMAVPPVRAAVLDWIQVGVIRVFFNPSPTAQEPVTEALIGTPTGTGSEPTDPFLQLDGATSKEEAARAAGFALRTPSYPADLGDPDRVIYQNLGGPVVIMVWLEDGSPDEVRMSLLTIGRGSFIGKNAPETVEHVQVGDSPGLWLSGPHQLYMRVDGREVDFSILGNVLIWEEGGVTYRLESNEPLEEAQRIAESMEP